jgi:hypothetical protein
MDRFFAYLLVRRHLKRPASRNQALAVEAIMEELAAHLGHPPEQWGIVGLFSQLDLEYAEHNPKARGRVAEEQARLEGLEPELAKSLGRWSNLDADARAPLEHALVLAAWLAEAALAYRRRHRTEGDPEQPFSEEISAPLSQDLELQSQAGDHRGDLLDESLQQLAVSADSVTRVALNGLRRVAQDLR